MNNKKYTLAPILYYAFRNHIKSTKHAGSSIFTIYAEFDPDYILGPIVKYWISADGYLYNMFIHREIYDSEQDLEEFILDTIEQIDICKCLTVYYKDVELLMDFHDIHPPKIIKTKEA